MSKKPSINTILLHVFSQLSSVDRSFSSGDVTLPDNGLFDSIIAAGGTPEFDGPWGEYTLRIPLERQCPCASCGTNATVKRAIEFRRVCWSYIQVRLKEHPSSSAFGLMDMAWRALALKPWHASAPGCRTRSLDPCTYSFETWDADTYALLYPMHVNEMKAESALYAERARTGNEFFVPTRMVDAACNNTVI